MRRTLLSLLTAALMLTPALTQDFGFNAAPGGPGGAALTGLVNRGVTGASSLSGFLGSANTTFPGGVDVASGDFNADGLPDIAVAQGGGMGGSLTIFTAEGDGTFGVPVSVGVMNQPIDVAVADVDLDGFGDIAITGVDYASDPSGQLQIFSGSNLSAGIPNPNPTQWLNGPPTSIDFGRIDGDAFPDVAVALGYGDGSGGVQTIMDYQPTLPAFGATGPGGPMAFAGGGTFYMQTLPTDVDIALPAASGAGGGDADFDLALATNNGIQLFHESPDSAGGVNRLSPAVELGYDLGSGMTTSASPHYILQIADVDGDNTTDVLALNGGSGSVSTFIGNASGGFQPPRTSMIGGNPVDMTILNFNNDGMPDLAVVTGGGPGGGGVQMLAGNGSGGFSTSGMLPLGSWPNVMAFGSASIFPRGQEPPNFNLGPGGSLNIINFCGLRPASCGGGGLGLSGRQSAVTAGTAPPSNNAMLRGEDHHASRQLDVIKGLGRFVGGLLTTGRPQPLASARYSVFATQQMRAQVEPAEVVITATGQSSGDFFRMEIIDQSGNVHRGMLPEGIVLEPVAAPPASPSADATVINQNVSGFCLDIPKDVPAPGTRYRIANAAAQAQASSIRNVLAASKQLALRNLLHSDGTTGYVNFVRQYAVWAKREGWDIKKFGESFVQKTKQNVLSMKANWTDVMEQGVRAAIPGRWRDIEEVLRLSSQIATPSR